MRRGARRSVRWNTGSCVAEAGPPDGPVKLVILPRTRAGLGRDGLRRHLETVHGPMVMAEPEVSGRFVTYVHHYAQVPDIAMPVLDDRDAVTIIRFATLADLAASKAAAGYRDVVGPDEDNFRDIEGSVALLVREAESLCGTDDALLKLFVFRTVGNFSDDALAGWADALRAKAPGWGITGAVTNVADKVEGLFPYGQFDELGLRASGDAALALNRLTQEFEDMFGPVPTSCILTEPVRFL